MSSQEVSLPTVLGVLKDRTYLIVAVLLQSGETSNKRSKRRLIQLCQCGPFAILERRMAKRIRTVLHMIHTSVSVRNLAVIAQKSTVRTVKNAKYRTNMQSAGTSI